MTDSTRQPRTIHEYMAQADALAQRPILADPAHRLEFYRRLRAQWTRKLNFAQKGRPQEFTPLEISELLDLLTDRIDSHANT